MKGLGRDMAPNAHVGAAFLLFSRNLDEGAVSIKDPTVIATAELSLFDSSKRQGHRAMGATVVEYLGCPFLVSECDELSVTDLKGEWFVARESRRRAGDIPTVLDQHGNLLPKYSFL
jgi:hypothetical protein|tara:strand:- start:282 stop:632 length:351 start_codon:yes stop_codon:yes gene_type:complete